MSIQKPACRYGYTDEQLKEILGDRYEEFQTWMAGQTGTICEGREWDEVEKSYHLSCDGVAHGLITYYWDLDRFLEGKPVVD